MLTIQRQQEEQEVLIVPDKKIKKREEEEKEKKEKDDNDDYYKVRYGVTKGSIYATSCSLLYLNGPVLDWILFPIHPDWILGYQRHLYCLSITGYVTDVFGLDHRLILFYTTWIAGFYPMILGGLLDPFISYFIYFMFIELSIQGQEYTYFIYTTILFFKYVATKPSGYNICNPFAWISMLIVFILTIYFGFLLYDINIPYFHEYVYLYILLLFLGGRESNDDSIWLYVIRKVFGYIIIKIKEFLFLAIIIQICWTIWIIKIT